MEQFSTPSKTPTRSILKEINSNDFINKSSGAANQGAVKSPLGLDSDISGINGDSTLGFDTTIDTSYKNEDPNATFGDLINGFGGLKLATPQHLSKPSNYDANNSVSSDDELFQECENGFDLEATAVDINKMTAVSVRAQSTNIDQNAFEKSADFSSIASVSTTAQTTTDITLPGETSDMLFKSNLGNQAIQSDSVSSANGSAFEVPSVESFAKTNPEEHQPEVAEIATEIAANLNENAVVEQSADLSQGNASIGTINVPDVSNAEVLETEQMSLVPDIEITPVSEIDGQSENFAQVPEENPIENTPLDQTVEIGSTQMNVTLPSVNNADETFAQSATPSKLDQTQVVENDLPTASTNSGDLDESLSKLNETVDVASISKDLSTTINVSNVLEAEVQETEQMVPEVQMTPVPEIDDKSDVVTQVLDENPIENAPLDQTMEIGSTQMNVTLPSVNNADETFAKSATPSKLDQTQDINVPHNSDHEEQPQVSQSEQVPDVQVSEIEGQSNTVASVLNTTNTQLDQSKTDVQPAMPSNDPLNVTVDLAAAAAFVPEINAIVNQTFEEMDVDMNETVDIQRPTEFKAMLNQTVEMADVDEVETKPALNITVNVAQDMNVTQVVGVKPIVSALLDQTIDISRMNTTPPTLNGVNETFIKSASPSMFNETHVVSQEFLSTTQTIESNNKTPTALPQFNLNETVVVENKLPTVDTSFTVAADPPAFEEFGQSPQESTFKVPTKPKANPFGKKAQSFDVDDDEFQTPGLILNSNDFDFLLQRGCNSGPIPRDSILERFDPILGRKSIVPAPLIKPEQIAAIPNISTIHEDVSPDPSIVESNESSDSLSKFAAANEPNVTFDDLGDIKLTTKLDTSLKLDLNISAENSQASSTTETYETASIGEPLKADVTMSVGLIHDLKMDNMKSLEQDKEEPNLKMNDENKARQEMVGDVERKLKEAEAREEALLRRITEKEKALNKMSAVVENYEKTMIEMISEREQIKQEHEKQLLTLKSERDDNLHHLTSLENTFSDLHVKYEKSKQMAVEVKESEAKLEEKLQFCQQQMKLQEQRYDKLKNHALSQLEGANSRLEALNKAHMNEMKKLTAQMKKEEISRQSTLDQLAQKTKENEELVKICDELINNAGS